MQYLDIEIKNKHHRIPNSWEALTPGQFVYLAGLLQQYASGALSVSDVRLRFVVYALGVDMSYVARRHQDVIAQNLYILQSNISFIFSIKYPAGVWNNLSADIKKLAVKTEPVNLPDSPEARILRRTDYSFVVDACFASQLLPEICVGKDVFSGYTINTTCGELSCSLTARQYVEASERLYGLSDNNALLPLLAAILYAPGTYSDRWAHGNASRFSSLDAATLQAIALNFQAFILLLFTKTHFSMLWSRDNKDTPNKNRISVGIKEGIYNLSEDGYGDIDKVGGMPLIEYLEILRKKKIDAVKAMHDAEMNIAEIAEKTGLDIQTINNIIN